LESGGFKIVFTDKSVSVFENTKALPRSFFVDKWEVITEEEKITDRLLDPGFDFSKTIILEETPPENTSGFIFTSDSWYPGWKAYVNGHEAKIYRADFAFRAVPVSLPDDKVEYFYLPDYFYNGLIISVGSLVLLAMTVAVLKLSMRKASNEK